MGDEGDAGPPLTLKERKQRLELAAASSSSSIVARSAPPLPVRARSAQPQWLLTKAPSGPSGPSDPSGPSGPSGPSRPDYALVQQYPPLSPTPSSLSRASGLAPIDTALHKAHDDHDALILFTSPVLPASDRGWGSATADSPAWRIEPPTPSTSARLHPQRPTSQERANSHPSPPATTAPELPPRRRAATLSPDAPAPDAPAPALPPRPRVACAPPAYSASPAKHRPSTSPTTARGRHSRHATPKEFESISLSSDGAASLALSLSLSSRSSSPSLRPPPRSSAPRPLSPKRRPIDPRSRARYDKLFDRCLNALKVVPRPAWVKRDDEVDALDALVVRGVWERSRLDRRTLSAIWTECDAHRRGCLRRDEFANGMWGIDEELRRRSKRLV